MNFNEILMLKNVRKIKHSYTGHIAQKTAYNVKKEKRKSTPVAVCKKLSHLTSNILEINALNSVHQN